MLFRSLSPRVGRLVLFTRLGRVYPTRLGWNLKASNVDRPPAELATDRSPADIAAPLPSLGQASVDRCLTGPALIAA